MAGGAHAGVSVSISKPICMEHAFFPSINKPIKAPW